ncbi:MAG: Maf family protein [Anaerolineae bacterium]|nr:Maf family protein [Anaerolineae bacterium]MDW8098853.1 Maf family protein [Anaerolineae bacterium]
MIQDFAKTAKRDENLEAGRTECPVASAEGAKLILASGSPRRRELLGALGIAFETIAADIDESAMPDEAPEALACRLSLEKAQVISRAFPEATVIGADTIVVLDQLVLGKPRSETEAIAMLKALRGRRHEVLSAVTLCRGALPLLQRLNRSYVWMRTYSDEEIAQYVASGDPLDKAGAYAIQHEGFRPVARWEGCYASIVGLPLGEVAALLRKAGWHIAVSVPDACRQVTGKPCCQQGEDSASDRTKQNR